MTQRTHGWVRPVSPQWLRPSAESSAVSRTSARVHSSPQWSYAAEVVLRMDVEQVSGGVT